MAVRAHGYAVRPATSASPDNLEYLRLPVRRNQQHVVSNVLQMSAHRLLAHTLRRVHLEQRATRTGPDEGTAVCPVDDAENHSVRVESEIVISPSAVCCSLPLISPYR